jgi:predicted transcriptional regulator
LTLSDAPFTISLMKSVRVQFDEALLARLDASQEVRQHGRSEVLQKAAADYLNRFCQGREAGEAIAEQYRRAYAGGASLGPELEGWEDQGAWPDD